MKEKQNSSRGFSPYYSDSAYVERHSVMTLLKDVVDIFLFSSAAHHPVAELIKLGWEQVNRKSWLDFQLDAFEAAVQDMSPRFAAFAQGNRTLLDKLALYNALQSDVVEAEGIDSPNVASRDQALAN